jgi:hypothetical protein
MNIDTTIEAPVDPNRSTDCHSIEIYIEESHALHTAASVEAKVGNDTDNEEELRLLHTLSLTCHKLQPDHDLSHHSDATSHNTDRTSIELLWSTIDTALKSLYQIWRNSTSKSLVETAAETSLLQKSTECSNVIVPDHEIEAVLSCILTIWYHCIDLLLNTENINDIILTSIVFSSIQLLSQSMHYKRWRHELIQHQIEKMVELLARTASFFLSKLSNNSNSRTCDPIHSNSEEKKNDDRHIDESNGSRNSESDSHLGIVKAVFRMVKDVGSIGSDDSKKANSTTHCDYMIVIYDAMCPVICDGNVYSNSTFMIDVSNVLWRWSVSLAQCMVRNAMVWNAIQYMWTNHSASRLEMDGRETVVRSLSSTVGMLIASASSEETTTDIVSSLLSSSPQSFDSEKSESIRTIQSQDWLIPMLLKGIHSHDTDSQRRCIRTLRYLTASSWGKSFVYQYAKRKDLTADLLPIIRNNGKHTDDTCALACQVVEHILSDGYAELQFGPYIETALIETIIGPSYAIDADTNDRGISSRNKLVWSACQALTASLRYSPWNRSTGCFTEALFDEMLYVLHNNIDQPSYHVCFVNLFLQLVAEEQRIDNVDGEMNVRTTRIKGICTMLATYSSVLEMFAILLSPNATKPDFDTPRSNTIRILTVLLEHDDKSNSIRNHMAIDEHLLTALVNVCLINNGLTPHKDDAKCIILTLIPEL